MQSGEDIMKAPEGRENMKKKALISAFVSIALAGAMCVSFAACDEFPLTSAKNAKDINSDKVTATQWFEAFENGEFYQNIKLEIKEDTVTELVDDGEAVQANSEYCATYIYTDEKTYGQGTEPMKSYVKETWKTTVTGNIPESLKDEPDFQERDKVNEYYVQVTDNGTKYIEKVNGNWTYTDSELNDANEKIEKCLRGIVEINGSLEFEDYEYSAAQNGYVIKNAKEGVLIVIKFKSKKLKAIYIENTTEENGIKKISTASYMITYGGQSVKLPAVANAD